MGPRCFSIGRDLTCKRVQISNAKRPLLNHVNGGNEIKCYQWCIFKEILMQNMLELNESQMVIEKSVYISFCQRQQEYFKDVECVVEKFDMNVNKMLSLFGMMF